jgi:hypothetical protein
MELSLPSSADVAAPRLGFLAILASVALHVSLLAALGWAEQSPPARQREAQAAVLRGTTFEMDLSSPTSASPSSEGPLESAPVPARGAASVDNHEPAREPRSPADVPAQNEPRAAPRMTPRPAATSRPAQEPSRANSAPSSSGEARYGAAEGATQVSLTRAFIKTLPLAAKLLSGWLELGLGAQKPVLVELRLDAAGHLIAIEILRGNSAELTAQSVRRNLVFLRSAQFASETHEPAALLFSIRAEVSMRSPSDELDSAEKVVALGQRFDPSRPADPPTGAYLTYGSGRHVEFEVKPVPLPR